MFLNAKAQAWFSLRLRFQATHRAVAERMPYSVDDIISINPSLPELQPLQFELCQPTYSLNASGKILVDKIVDGMKSPNLGDAVMLAFSPASRALEVWAKLAT
jgi:phage terminase large subunit